VQTPSVDRIELDVLTLATNQAVIRLPGRKYPGIVLQGDSLSILASDAREVADALAAGGDPAEDAADLADRLDALLGHYARTLTAHGIPLPYMLRD
jgi:hypothetical protein